MQRSVRPDSTSSTKTPHARAAAAVKKTISWYAPTHDLSPLLAPSCFEDRRHRFLDLRGPRPRLLRAGEVKQVSRLRTATRGMRHQPRIPYPNHRVERLDLAWRRHYEARKLCRRKQPTSLRALTAFTAIDQARLEWRGAREIARRFPVRPCLEQHADDHCARWPSMPMCPVSARGHSRRACGSGVSIWAAIADGLFDERARSLLRKISARIDRSMLIVVESEQIADRRNSPLNSTARIFDGLGVGSLPRAEQNSAGFSAHYNGQK